ncbi:MAG TPA: vitamin K epoxide reductase family protein [Candidatus Binatia bacterium]
MPKSPRKKIYAQAAKEPLRSAPNWPLLAIAAAGMALTAYLTVAAWRGQSVAGCAAGSVCDAVLGSQWAKLFGLPTSFWGFLTYAALAAIAFIKRARLHWKAAFVVAFFGVLYSAYLTSISLLALHAACPYCLTSFALMAAIFALTVYQRPADMAGFSWTPWILSTLAGAAVVIVLLHLNYTGAFESTFTADPKLAALADHLTAMNAKFYGASWCPHCKEQKNIFGAAADRLPYVECSAEGPRGPETPVCHQMQIVNYPTWIINGRRYEGVLGPEELARLSGFTSR